MTTKTSNKEKILSIAAGGVVIALAFVLSKITLFEMPMGGSITPASTLPIIVYGMAFGPFWGFIVAVVYSILQLIDGLRWFVSPFQMFLDYVIGYAALGIAGFAGLKAEERIKIKNPLFRFRRAGIVRAAIFAVVAYVIRWIGSVASGVIFYAEYAADAGYDNALIYSMVYNGSFLAVDLGICIAALIVLYLVIPSKKAELKD
ncbi:MAG: energy-coupled thiamine transporter ThiT [Saccharofermentans sp.]|nr:energy-coupled thiamine transporter ThiT [Saccharofermentans sp.]